jgi:probable blue pigment (indigoidine) exporter
LHLSDRAKGIALGLVSSVAWGTTVSVARYLTDVRHVHPLVLTASRFLLAYVVLRRKGRVLLESMDDAPRFLLLGLLGVVAMGGMIFTATRYTYSINAALIMNANGIFIAALAFLAGETVPRVRFLGLGVGLLGCCLAVAGRIGLPVGGQNDLVGGALALGAAIAWALYTLWGKGVAQRWGGLAATTGSLCFGAVVMAIIVLACGLPLRLAGVEFWLVVYVALVPTALAFACWYAAMEYVPANLIGPLQYVAPIVGIAIGNLVLHEPIRLTFALGTLLVFAGVWLATRPGSGGEDTTPVPEGKR